MAKLKNRPHYGRSGPTAKQQAEIERLTSPKSPQDLVDALNNPATPAYQQMMNMLINNIQIEIIIERLIERFITQQVQAEKRDKELMFKDMLEKAIHDQEKMRQSVPRLVEEMEGKRLQTMQLDDLQKLWQQKSQESAILKKEIADLYKVADELKQQRSEHVTQWTQLDTKQVDDQTKALKEKGIGIIVFDAESKSMKMLDPESKEAKQFLLQAKAPPIDEKFLRILGPSYEIEDTAASKQLQAAVERVKAAGEALIDTVNRPSPATKGANPIEELLTAVERMKAANAALVAAVNKPSPAAEQQRSNIPVPPPLPPKAAIPTPPPMPKAKPTPTPIRLKDMQKKSDVVEHFHFLRNAAGGDSIEDLLNRNGMDIKLNDKMRELLGKKDQETARISGFKDLLLLMLKCNPQVVGPSSEAVAKERVELMRVFLEDIAAQAKCDAQIVRKESELAANTRLCSIIKREFNLAGGKDLTSSAAVPTPLDADHRSRLTKK